MTIDQMFRKIFSELNEHERRLNNMIIPGKAINLSEDRKKVQVGHGNNTTPFIRWFANFAGEIREYRAPSIGEQCVLLNLTGGKDSGKCVALFGFDTTEFSLPSNDPAEHKIVYPNGTVFTHNHETNRYELTMPSGSEMHISIPEKITFTTDMVEVSNDLHVKGKIKGDQDIIDKKSSMDAMRSAYNGHTHNGNVPPPNQKMT